MSYNKTDIKVYSRKFEILPHRREKKSKVHYNNKSLHARKLLSGHPSTCRATYLNRHEYKKYLCQILTI